MSKNQYEGDINPVLQAILDMAKYGYSEKEIEKQMADVGVTWNDMKPFVMRRKAGTAKPVTTLEGLSYEARMAALGIETEQSKAANSSMNYDIRQRELAQRRERIKKLLHRK